MYGLGLSAPDQTKRELLPEWPIFLNLLSLNRKAHQIMHLDSSQQLGGQQLSTAGSKLEEGGCPALKGKTTTRRTNIFVHCIKMASYTFLWLVHL